MTRCDSVLAWRKARAVGPVRSRKNGVNPPRRRSRHQPARRQPPGVGLHAPRRRVLSKMKKSALMGTLQKTGLELRRAIIKEVRGHFVKCRFYSTQERLSIGDYGWEWRLEQKGRAFARSEPVGRPVPCGCGEISSPYTEFLCCW